VSGVIVLNLWLQNHQLQTNNSSCKKFVVFLHFCSTACFFVPAYGFSTGVTMQYTESILLSRLLAGPRSHYDLLGNGSLSTHIPFYLESMEERGLILKNNDHWHITQYGKDALAQHRKPNKRNRYADVRESYNGAELRHRVQRDGAYDFLKCPSKMGSTLVYRKDSV
jgi:hypothetical protein